MRHQVYRVCEGDGLYLNEVNVQCVNRVTEKRQHKQIVSEEVHRRYKDEFSEDLILEISGGSRMRLGNALQGSRLNLTLSSKRTACVNAILLGSQRFSRGGPYVDLYEKSFYDASLDLRLKTMSRLLDYRFGRTVWPVESGRYFYEWLFLKAIHENKELASQLIQYRAFSNVTMNTRFFPFNEARSAALYVLLHHRNLLKKALSSQNSFTIIARRIKLKTHLIMPTEWIIKE